MRNTTATPLRLASIAIFAVAMTMSAEAQDRIYRVDIANGSTTGDGQDWGTDAMKFLQDALTAAVAWHSIPGNGDDEIEIRVAEGTYTPDRGTGYTQFDRSHSFELRSNVRLLGGWHPSGMLPPDPVAYPTILSGDLEQDDYFEANFAWPDAIGLTFDDYVDNSFIVVRAESVNRTAELDGFIVQSSHNFAMTSSVPPAATYLPGAGLWIIDGAPTIRNCVIRRNYVLEEGLSVIGNGRGGGVHVTESDNGAVHFYRCVIEHNFASKGGGGLFVVDSGDIEMIECTITGNSVHDKDAGGGVWINGAENVALVNCAISHNYLTSPEHHAAGLDVEADTIQLWNCLIARNRSYPMPPTGTVGGVGGLRINGNAEIINCTIVDNMGLLPDSSSSSPHGGILVESGTVAIRNSIIWDNDGEQLVVESGSTVTVAQSNVEGTVWSGTGNISSSPMFIDPENLDYRLDEGSPSIDAGDTDMLPCDEYDIAPGVQAPESTACSSFNDRLHPIDLDQMPRVARCTASVDQGAYEYELPPNCPDIDEDDYVGIDDIIAMLNIWGTCADECDCIADLNGDGEVDVDDLYILFASWGEFDCETLTGGGEPVPQSVEDCYDFYFDPENTARYEACLEMIEQLAE